MAEAEYKDVRVKESLRVKIGEAKNLPATSFSGSARNTCCAIKIDSEEIFRTNTVEKSTDPFFAAEFQGEIPKKFRCLSFYMYEVGNKNKVLGKVSLKKEELYKYHQKEHWFPLTYQDGDTAVQGKVHVEVKMDECLVPSSDISHRMSVRLIECSDLTVINGSCNPYAVVSLSYGKPKTKETKKTSVKKKTICPHFGETFYFSIDNRGQSQEKSSYVFDDFMTGELSISLFHDDSKVSREVLGNIFKGAFLGEIKISIKDIDFYHPHRAWYCLQAKQQNRTNDLSLGSIRLRIAYTADYVFPSKYYDGLRKLILKSVETKPFTSSTVFIVGEIVNHRESIARENAAQPLVKLFLHHGKLVPVINALACWEMSTTTDPNTLFRGNSLLTKMVDELMKIIGLPYLHDTLKCFVHKVISHPRPCEIDPGRLKDGEDLEANMINLCSYVNEALSIIVGSGLVCPPIMRDVFCTLKSQAILKYRNDEAVRYHAVTSFIFLRFFTAAIMGPNLFDLYSDTLDSSVQRTFTLISKGISGLVSLVSSKSNTVASKEEYMTPLFQMFPHLTQAEIKMFLDIISSSTGSHVKLIEAPILLKEGFLIKRAQGRKRFGIINFQKRFFRLSNQSLSYCKNKGDKHVLFEIPITDILAVERLEEESFKMKYMFQVVYAERLLYIQASNCVEEKEWLDILTKICKSNQNRLRLYHPAAYINNHWLCCKLTDPSMPGCKPATGGLPVDDILGEIDSDQEVEKIHSLLLSSIDLLDDLLGYIDEDEIVCDEKCGSQAVYAGETEAVSTGLGSDIEDPSSCFSTIREIQNCIITLEQEHLQYMHFLQSRTVIGSADTPIGDETNTDLVRNINRSSERLSRHGSRSSNASNISRQSFRRSRSRGGSFQERDQINLLMGGVRKSLSSDMSIVTQNMDAVMAAQVQAVSSSDDFDNDERRTRSASGDSGTDCRMVDTSGHGDGIIPVEIKMIDEVKRAKTDCDDSGLGKDCRYVEFSNDNNNSIIPAEIKMIEVRAKTDCDDSGLGKDCRFVEFSNDNNNSIIPAEIKMIDVRAKTDCDDSGLGKERRFVEFGSDNNNSILALNKKIDDNRVGTRTSSDGNESSNECGLSDSSSLTGRSILIEISHRSNSLSTSLEALMSTEKVELALPHEEIGGTNSLLAHNECRVYGCADPNQREFPDEDGREIVVQNSFDGEGGERNCGHSEDVNALTHNTVGPPSGNTIYNLDAPIVMKEPDGNLNFNSEAPSVVRSHSGNSNFNSEAPSVVRSHSGNSNFNSEAPSVVRSHSGNSNFNSEAPSVVRSHSGNSNFNSDALSVVRSHSGNSNFNSEAPNVVRSHSGNSNFNSDTPSTFRPTDAHHDTPAHVRDQKNLRNSYPGTCQTTVPNIESKRPNTFVTAEINGPANKFSHVLAMLGSSESELSDETSHKTVVFI